MTMPSSRNKLRFVTLALTLWNIVYMTLNRNQEPNRREKDVSLDTICINVCRFTCHRPLNFTKKTESFSYNKLGNEVLIEILKAEDRSAIFSTVQTINFLYKRISNKGK